MTEEESKTRRKILSVIANPFRCDSRKVERVLEIATRKNVSLASRVERFILNSKMSSFHKVDVIRRLCND